MTENSKSAGRKGRRMSAGQVLFCVMSALSMLLTFVLSDVAIQSMSLGMRLCVRVVIPTLFPFMVLSELLISSGAAELAGRWLARPLARMLDISEEGAVSVLLGLLCGFPIGAKCAISLYERGRISKGELEHLCTFCNSPSSAFLVGAVGVGSFGSRDFGVLLYAVHILSALIIGLIGRAYFKERKRRGEYISGDSGALPRREGFARAFTEAVTGSAASMLYICAFVVFFSAVLGMLRYFADQARMPDELTVLMLGFFEMTGGVSAAAELGRDIALPAVAAITGWSGLSVHFQLLGICGEHHVAGRPYFLAKAGGAVLNAAAVLLAVRAFGARLTFGGAESTPSLMTLTSSPLAVVSVAVFLCGCVMLRKKRDG